MSGLRLAEMDASDMLDVIHYYFEEDYVSVTNQEQYIYRQEFRENVYKNLYETGYAYYNESLKSDSGGSAPDIEAEDEVEVEELINPFNPRAKKETKAYIEPSLPMENSEKPFGDILDMPLG